MRFWGWISALFARKRWARLNKAEKPQGMTADPPGAEAQFDYDLLEEGLQSGRFGGLPRANSLVHGLVEVLRLARWPVNFRAFAGAMPHFAHRFGIDELRATLSRLGFATQRDKVLGRNLDMLPPGSFVLLGGNLAAFPRLDSDGRPGLIDPRSGKFLRLQRGREYECYVVRPNRTGERAAIRKVSWLRRQFGRFNPEMNLILVLTCISNILVVVASLSVAFIYDKVLPAQAMDTLIALLCGVGLLIYFDLTLRRLKSRIIGQVAGRLEYIISNALYEKLIRFPVDMLTSVAISDQLNRLKQFETVRDFFGGPIVAVLFELPFSLALLLIVFSVSQSVGLVLLATVAIYTVLGLVIYPHISRATKEMSNLRSECMRVQEETLGQRQQIVRRGLGDVWAARLSPRFLALSRARQRVETIWRVLNTLIAVATPLAIGAVMFTGAAQVIAGNMTGGSLIACMILSTRLLSPVQQALILAVRTPDLVGLFQQIDMMMQIQTRGAAGGGQSSWMLRKATRAPDVRIDGALLRYPKSIAPALKGISCTFEGGSITCITGPSGAGKSTLLRAVIGHYSLQSGAVLIGDCNVQQLAQIERSSLIGHLGHQTLQIHGTMAQNLLLSKPEATEAEMFAICEEMGIRAEIEALPARFETKFDHNARAIYPPGFRTKFALAQILLKRPRVLLLDEPEGGLTNEDEALIWNAIKARSGEMTTLLVTHRPGIMRKGDQLLAMESGVIRFHGSPAELDARSA